jgi:hypothetical protein
MAAKQKQPSMLTRQRQLRRQQQATKAASRNQLPSSGNTTASSTRAQAQRVGTAVRQRANQDMTVIRALADNMKRNQARSDRQIKPDPSPKTRYVGPGGANPKAKQLPPGTKGGQMQAKGGPIVKAGSSQVTPGQRNAPAQQVRVQDLGNTKESNNKPASQRGLGSGSPRSLPEAGKSGGSQPPKGTSVPQRGGPQRTAAQAASERRSAAASRAAGSAQGTSTTRVSTGTPVGEATKAATRGSNLARGVRNFVGRGSGPLAAGLSAVDAYSDARNRGETKGRSAAQGFAAAAGFASGAKAGLMIPGGPLVKVPASIIGGALGAQAALRSTQGVQEAAKAASQKYKTNSSTPKKPERQGPTMPDRLLAASSRSSSPTNTQSSSTSRTRQAETQSGGRPRSASQQSSTSVPSAPRAPKAPPAPRAPQSAPKAPDSPSMSGVGPTKDGSLYSDKLKISQIEAGKEPDMERRRAFLDAKDSMSGVKAVKELLAKRKKRMGEG